MTNRDQENWQKIPRERYTQVGPRLTQQMHLIAIALALGVLQIVSLEAATLPTELRFSGRVFEKDRSADAGGNSFLYRFESEENLDSARKEIRGRFLLPDGKVFATEEARLFSGELRHYQMQLPVMHESAKIWREPGVIHFEYEQGGKKRHRVESYTNEQEAKVPIVVGVSLVAILRSKWNETVGGTPLKVRIAVPDRMETFGFEFVYQGATPFQGKSVSRFLFRPTSLLVSWVVPPLEFDFETGTQAPVRIAGKTFLKKPSSGGWDDMLAETFFDR